MTKKLRRLIFWIFVAFFIAASIGVLFYAQGWRLDFKSFKFVKTGGIFIETSISGAKIYINDSYIVSTSGILNYSRLIGGLTPASYNVFVYKEGFYPWNKTIDVKDGLVSGIKNIILFPLELKKMKVAEFPNQTVTEFSVKDERAELKNAKLKTAKVYDFGGKLLLTSQYKAATATPEIISSDSLKKLYTDGNRLWVDYLKDVKNEPVKSAGETDLIAVSDSPVKFFDWLSDSEHIIWFSGTELAIAERDNRGGKRNVIKIYLDIDPPIYFDRNDFDFYFFEKNGPKMILYKLSL